MGMILVSGGSGSGKSAYAERIACQLQPGKKWYIATMYPYDEESQDRVARHRRMRSGKGFETQECFTGLQQNRAEGGYAGETVLLECISNLVANEMYMEGGANVQAVSRILADVEKLRQECENLIIVTNDVFTDGVQYDYETERYIHYLGEINFGLAEMADAVIEVVCGCPVVHKGIDPCA